MNQQTNNKKIISRPITRPQDGLGKQPIPPAGDFNNLQNILGFIEVLTVAPTYIPKTFYDSIKLVDDTGTYYLYLYMQGIGWVSTVVT